MSQDFPFYLQGVSCVWLLTLNEVRWAPPPEGAWWREERRGRVEGSCNSSLIPVSVIKSGARYGEHSPSSAF